MTPRRTDRRAFALVELLVAIGLLGLLMGLLLPSLSRAREQAQSIKCLSNLRQMAIACADYTANNDGNFPIAQYSRFNGGVTTSVAWDFTTVIYWNEGKRTEVRPGLLWDGRDADAVQQCPSYGGGHNWLDDPYTGYNYNTSFLGHGQGSSIESPANVSDVKAPDRCALFGDGGYAAGANKFMRAPLPNPGDATFVGRQAGTQAFRHLGRTNVVFVDGHAESRDEIYTDSVPGVAESIAPGTGFLSPDNRLYDYR